MMENASFALYSTNPPDQGKFTNVAFTIFANRPFAMLSTLMQ